MNMHSFLLIGQSNMAGRGFLNEAVPVDTTHIYVMRNGRWQKMFRPINPDRSFSGASLAESFAESYTLQHGEKVGLICCADGGTAMEQWMPGSVLYDNAVFHARLAQRSSTLAGILWHQGESDCTSDCQPLYEQRLLTMICRLREDLGLPDVPILLGGLGDYLVDCPRSEWNLENYTLINNALQSVAQTMKNVAFVPANGLQSNPDKLHFNAASLHEFGRRYFEAYDKLTEGKQLQTGSIAADTERTAMEQL